MIGTKGIQGIDGKCALVTGANGFIGSHLVELLLAEGAQVRAFCMYNSNSSYGWLDDLPRQRSNQLDLRLGDIRDRRSVREAVDGVDLVFHLAALIAIPYSYQAPSSYVETNIAGTLNVLEAVRDERTAMMVNTSTSEVYGTPDSLPIVENHPVQAQSPYAATKIAADQLCCSYVKSFGTPIVTLRPFNTYGPRQSMRAIIPTILGQLLSGARNVCLGSLSPRRDLTYVADTVDGFVRMAAADLCPGSVVQLGTGKSISISELFDLCCKTVGTDATVTSEPDRVRPEKSEVQVLLSDPQRAKEEIDWRAKTTLEDGLAATAGWLRHRVDNDRVRRYHK